MLIEIPFNQTVFHVIDKKNGEVLSSHHQCKAMFVFHHINAYEQDGCIVVDLSAYEDDKIFHYFSIDYMKSRGRFDPPLFRRYVLPIHTDKVRK